MSDLVRVSKSHPCLICGKFDWCGYTPDGKIAICMRVKSDKPSQNSGFIHYLDNFDHLKYSNLKPQIKPIPYSDHQKADGDTSHKVYTEFLNLLSLSPEHYQNLERRSHSEEQIKRHEYRTLPEKGRYLIAKFLIEMFGIDTMSQIPGFMVADYGNGPYPTFSGSPGLFIPIKDYYKKIVGFQIRIDHPDDPKDRYRWFSSSDRFNGTSSGTPIHVVYPPEILQNRIWITEGAIKANISADLIKEIFLGIAGVSNWQSGNIISILKKLSADTVIIAFDADSSTNPFVKQQENNLAKSCKEAGYKVQLATWPIELGKGIDDLLVNGHKPDIKDWIEESQINIDHNFNSDIETVSDIKWPVLHQDALYGFIGDVVKTIEPHTESDPAAIMVQLLVTYGNRVGRNAYFTVENDGHYTNLFTVIVGNSSKARKGTSYGRIKKLIKDADPSFESPPGGLVSGEGLIYHVRDAVYESVQDQKTGNLQEVCKDGGVDDKRLLVFESEFSSVLKVLKRDGNTLSETLRQAWDSGDLNTLAKNSKTRSTNAHISLIGHITSQELKRELDEVSYANGFGNRILWCLVKRSKYLPEGSQVPDHEMDYLKAQLYKAIQFSKQVTEIKRDEKARQLWKEVYPTLSEGKPGLAGAMASRAEAQVLRISCIYALLDLSSKIKVEHLKAAMAVWDYSFQSCRYIFGDALGDPIADQIWEILKRNPQGLTRTEIYNIFGCNKSSKLIVKALNTLIECSLVKCQIRKTKGRPVEVWVINEKI